jgi:hypothetical protein
MRMLRIQIVWRLKSKRLHLHLQRCPPEQAGLVFDSIDNNNNGLEEEELEFD